jgi:hypothetical protein
VLRKISMRQAKDRDTPLADYVLASIFGDLEARWESRPVLTDQADAAVEALRPLVEQVIHDAQPGMPEAELVASLNQLVRSFVKLQTSGDIG